MCRDTITADRERHLQRCRRRLRKVCNADACGAGRLLQAIQRVPEGLQLGACVTLSPIFSKKCTLRRDGTCPGGTVVSAKCADRSAFGENPCACTALQELAALSSFLHNEAPWNDTRRTWPTARPGASTWSARRSAGCSCPRWSAGPARASRAELAADMSAGVGGRADLPKTNFAWSWPGGGGGAEGQWEGGRRGGGVKGSDGS